MQTLWRTVWKFLKILKVECHIIQQSQSRKDKKFNSKINVHPIFIAALFTVAKTWASLVAQLVKNLPAIQETPVQFLGWKDSLELWASSILGLP